MRTGEGTAMEDNLVLKALEVLKGACKHLQGVDGCGERAEDEEDPAEEKGFPEEDDPCNSPSMKALLVLHSESQDGGLLSADPALSTLSSLLSRLKSLYLSYYQEAAGDGGGGGLLEALGGGIGGVLSSLLDLHRLLLKRNGQGRRKRSKVARRCREISRVAGSIESEIQSWIDRESVGRLVSALRSSPLPAAEEEEALIGLLRAFEERLSRGFDRGLQDVILRSGAFSAVAAVLSSPSAALRLREHCAASVAAMVRFNRDVFVGNVLMGGGGGDESPSVLRSLVSIGSPASMRVLRTLVVAIKTALVDEIHADSQLPRLVNFLSSPDIEMTAAAAELLLQMAYYARKEAVDAMLEANVVKRLAVLQRSDLGGVLIEMEDGEVFDDDGCGGPDRERDRWRPFASCVARFAIQLEIGEGLRRREKAAAKANILERVKEAAASEAEAAAIVAEVLWGASH